MRINGRDIGGGRPPFIIAEIGVNHDGCPDRALRLVEAAAEAGADAVKFQLFRAELLLGREAQLALYQRHAGETDPMAMLSRLELTSAQIGQCVALARRLGMAAVLTVFSPQLVEEAEREIGPDAYKSASPDLVNPPLLGAMAATGRPLIVSTGAATRDEVAQALKMLGPVCDGLALLQCVSAYPTPDAEAALGGIGVLRSMHGGPVGYSDHTAGTDTGALAVAAGADLLEKHLTDDRTRPGPDHAASLDAGGFGEYVRLARRAWEMLGPREKRVRAVEEDVRAVSRQSIATARDLPAGHRLTAEDLTVRRPGTGISPGELDGVVGSVLAESVRAGSLLSRTDLEVPAAGVRGAELQGRDTA